MRKYLVDQNTDKLDEAVAYSPVERRRTLVVLQSQVGASTNQQPHGVDVVAASCPQHRHGVDTVSYSQHRHSVDMASCPQHGHGVDAVTASCPQHRHRVDTASYSQHRHDVDVVAASCPQHKHGVGTTSCPQTSAQCRHGELQHRHGVDTASCPQHGRVVLVVAGVDVDATVEKQLDEPAVSVQCRQVDACQVARSLALQLRQHGRLEQPGSASRINQPIQ